jgi:hypothetical protein
MKLVSLIVLFLVLLGGCALKPLPTMPTYTSEKGKACARQCQGIYVQCNYACGAGLEADAPLPAYQRKQCLDRCGEALRDCYYSCE